MTLEEEAIKILNSNFIENWDAKWAEEDYKYIKSNSWYSSSVDLSSNKRKNSLFQSMLKQRLGEGLLSPFPYIRRLSELIYGDLK